MQIHTRQGSRGDEPYEKIVLLPELNDKDISKHLWADARFAVDIMAEHAFFFVLLMPEEVAGKQRKEAYQFFETFSGLGKDIDRMSEIKNDEIKPLVNDLTEEIKKFVEFKKVQQEAQETGKLRSLVWPLFFEHTWREGERWNRRLEKLAQGYSEYEESEVVPFWIQIMEEHARFIAHLLDPQEIKLIEAAMKESKTFSDFMSRHNESKENIDEVKTATATMLDFKTKAVRGIEEAKIKSIIDPRLADHVRREALKFVNELDRLG